MQQTKKPIDTKKTFNQGLAGGILGACIGVPGLGVVLGVANANKGKIQEFVKNVDDGMNPKSKR